MLRCNVAGRGRGLRPRTRTGTEVGSTKIRTCCPTCVWRQGANKGNPQNSSVTNWRWPRNCSKSKSQVKAESRPTGGVEVSGVLLAGKPGERAQVRKKTTVLVRPPTPPPRRHGQLTFTNNCGTQASRGSSCRGLAFFTAALETGPVAAAEATNLWWTC